MTGFKLSPAIHRKVDTLWAKVQRLHIRGEHTDAVVPRLPPELTDGIIDHLRRDKAALICCSLVCTSFLNRSYHHLFRVMNMRDTKRFRRFIALLPSATLRQYVEVVVLGNSGSTDVAAFMRLRLDVESLGALLDATPALQYLELNCLTWAPTAAPDGERSGSPTTKNIKHVFYKDVLSSESGVPLALGELISLFRLFGAVTKLTMHSSISVDASPGFALRPGSRMQALQVRDLTLQADVINAPFLQFLRTTGTTKTLKVIHVDAVDKATVSALGSLLRDAKAVISVLQVDVMSLGPPHKREYKPERLCKALDIPANLAGCTSLRTLRFWITMSDGLGPIGTWHWRFFFAVLTDAVANLPNVEHIVLCVTLGKNPQDALAHMPEIDWAQLENLLRRFTQLSCLAFGTPSPRRRTQEMLDVDKKLWKIAKKRLPVLYANKVLRWSNTYTN
ncbi:hypothetical protein EIP86_006693 [Pleurotus ostreatoroseus]|nr:hypothetical protein EIP86_006693 [Pleurotus ostreatoroseus]